MRCPHCADPDTKVVDSREAEDGAAIRRRRVCDSCGERFTTFERSESARIQVVKRDGSREEFDRRKLASAIGKGASKQLTPKRIGEVIEDIESTIRASGTAEVTSQRVGEMVLERLASLDPMSYLRFKIVYARMDDPDALYDELAQLVRVREAARGKGLAEQTRRPIAEPAAARPAPARRRR
ncbi:MAG: transcriptional regulator NrdR [Candidatus Limnocylindria bacterium]